LVLLTLEKQIFLSLVPKGDVSHRNTEDQFSRGILIPSAAQLKVPNISTMGAHVLRNIADLPDPEGVCRLGSEKHRKKKRVQARAAQRQVQLSGISWRCAR
jgi:hypothetical protein